MSDDALERWAIAARSAYLGRCPVLRMIQERHGLELQVQTVSGFSGAPLGRPSTVVVTVGVPEVRSRSFVITVRIRPIGEGSGAPVNVGWVIRLLSQRSGRVHGITDDIRDELIHLERSAEHWN